MILLNVRGLILAILSYRNFVITYRSSQSHKFMALGPVNRHRLLRSIEYGSDRTWRLRPREGHDQSVQR